MDDKAVQKFFLGKSTQHHLFDLLKQYIQTLGFVEMKVTKSQISFSNKRQFAWVWLPMPWDKKRPKDSTVLSFSLGEKTVHPQIVQIVEPYPGRFMHHVILEKESDINDDVKKWLKRAYNFFP
jgi:hypothetical protein